MNTSTSIISLISRFKKIRILILIIGLFLLPTYVHAYYIANYSPPFLFTTPTSEITPLFKENTQCTVPAKIPAEIEIAFQEAIKDIPCDLIQSLQKIDIFEDIEGNYPRAMANARIIKIREDAIYEKEFVNVLIHELGHVVDLGGLTSNYYKVPSVYTDGAKQFYIDDISTEFYKISWENEHTRRSNMTKQDFVSGYSYIDMFEDFSESFLLYLNHGNVFREMAKDNSILMEKYIFFKDNIFQGKEFQNGENNYIASKRVWDITYL